MDRPPPPFEPRLLPPPPPPGGLPNATPPPPIKSHDSYNNLFSDDDEDNGAGTGATNAPQDPTSTLSASTAAATAKISSGMPSYKTMGEAVDLPSDVTHIEEVEWAHPGDLQPGRYTDKAARPPLDRVSDPCGCVADGSGTMCCLDMSCVLFACQEECRSNCEAGDLCGNKRIQRKEWKQLQVFDAGPKGRGLRLLEPAKKGEFICEYVGVAIKKDHLESLFARYQGERMLYIMALDNDVYIDARKKGGIARYINHSCEPNCMVDRWKVRGVSRACVFALRDIAAGEELSFDYQWTRKRGRAPTVCHCGSTNCRGTLEMPKDESLEDEELSLKLSGHWKVPITQNPGNEIINRVIKVYFEGDREYYIADVAQYDEKTGKHQIIYKSDLSDAWEDLSQLQWMILDREFEQFIIAKKSARSTTIGTPLGQTPAKESMARNYLLVQTYVKEALEVRKILSKCQHHFRVGIDILACDDSEIRSREGQKTIEGSADGKLWKLVVTGMDPVKARKYLENNVETCIRKTAEQAAIASAKSALDAKSASGCSREIIIPRSIVDDVKRKLHTIRFSAGRNTEVNFTHSESKSKQFAKLTIQAESSPELQQALEGVWRCVFKICVDSGGAAELTPTGIYKDLGVLAGELKSEEFELLFQNSSRGLNQNCSENLREDPFFASFENIHRCTIWVQAAEDMGRIDSHNRVVGEAGADASRKVFIGAAPQLVVKLWEHIRGRVDDLTRGVKFFNLGTDRVYFPALTSLVNGGGIDAGANRAQNKPSFFTYVQKATGATVEIDKLTNNHLRIDGGEATSETDEEPARRIALAEEMILLQIELLRDHFVRKQRWAFGRDWSLLMTVDSDVKKKDTTGAAPSRASPTPGSFSATRHTSDSRAVVSSCMEIAEICATLDLDRAVGAHACVIFYRFLNQLSDFSTTAATHVKLREAALACVFLANKAQKVRTWKRLEVVLKAAYETFYSGAQFDERSEEAANWEKRVILAEAEILETLQYDVFWSGIDWIISAVVESGKVAEPLADNAMNLTLSGPVLAAGPTVWLQFGPEYVFAAIAGLLSINMDSVFSSLPVLPQKVSQSAQIIVKSIEQNVSTAKKYSKAAHAQLFQGSQMSLLNNVADVQLKCKAKESDPRRTRTLDETNASAWEKAHIAVGKESQRSRVFKGVSFVLINERILPILDDICAESRSSVFFREGSSSGTENIVLEGSWRAIAIAEFLIESAISSSASKAASDQSRLMGLTPRADSSLDLTKTTGDRAAPPSLSLPRLPAIDKDVAPLFGDGNEMKLPSSEDVECLNIGIDQKQAKLKPGVMSMDDVKIIPGGWAQSSPTAGEEPLTRGQAPKIGGKTCIPAIASESSFKAAGLRWWIPPQYAPSLSGSLSDILSVRKALISGQSSHLQELAKLASTLEGNGSAKGGPSFTALKSYLSSTEVIGITRDRSIAVSVQQWPPIKIAEKEQAKEKGAMRVGFSPTALQEMQILQQLHHLIPAPQGHPNFVLPIAVAIEYSIDAVDSRIVPSNRGASGLSSSAVSSNPDVSSFLTMIKKNPVDEKKKRKSGSVSHLIFQPTPFVLQKVVSRTIKKKSSSGGSKRGLRLVTPTIFAAWFHDLLTAMAMCHSNHIVIRSINPDQILVDYSGVAMLSGFNRSTVLRAKDRRKVIDPLEHSRGAKQSDEMPSDPFIAPEILLGSSRYTKETDIFALGSLMAQLLVNKPIFAGKDRSTRLGAMYKFIGTPGSAQYSEGRDFPHYEWTKPEKKYKRNVEKAFRFMSKGDLDFEGEYAGVLDLLAKMLHLDPRERISPADALQHEYMVNHVNSIKSGKYRAQFVKDWMHLRDSILLDKDLRESSRSATVSSPANRLGLLKKNTSIVGEMKKDATGTKGIERTDAEKESKRKAMLLEVTASGGDGEEDDLYNMDDLLEGPFERKSKKPKL